VGLSYGSISGTAATKLLLSPMLCFFAARAYGTTLGLIDEALDAKKLFGLGAEGEGSPQSEQ